MSERREESGEHEARLRMQAAGDGAIARAKLVERFLDLEHFLAENLAPSRAKDRALVNLAKSLEQTMKARLVDDLDPALLEEDALAGLAPVRNGES